MNPLSLWLYSSLVAPKSLTDIIPITNIREKNMDKHDQIRHRVIMDLMSYESIDLNKFYNLNKISFAEYFKSELNRLKLTIKF